MSVPDEPVCPCGWPEPHPKLGVFSYASAIVLMNTLAGYFLERGYTLTSKGGDSRELSTADGRTIRLVLKQTWDRHCHPEVGRWVIGVRRMGSRSFIEPDTRLVVTHLCDSGGQRPRDVWWGLRSNSGPFEFRGLRLSVRLVGLRYAAVPPPS